MALWADLKCPVLRATCQLLHPIIGYHVEELVGDGVVDIGLLDAVQHVLRPFLAPLPEVTDEEYGCLEELVDDCDLLHQFLGGLVGGPVPVEMVLERRAAPSACYAVVRATLAREHRGERVLHEALVRERALKVHVSEHQLHHLAIVNPKVVHLGGDEGHGVDALASVTRSPRQVLHGLGLLPSGYMVHEVKKRLLGGVSSEDVIDLGEVLDDLLVEVAG